MFVKINDTSELFHISWFVYVCTFRLVIRGDPSDDAVLCTKDKTFELRVADTSNMLLLTPSLTFHGDSSEIKFSAKTLFNRIPHDKWLTSLSLLSPLVISVYILVLYNL